MRQINTVGYYKFLTLILIAIIAGIIGVACEGPAGAEGSQGPQGPEGPPGPGTDPSISGVTPITVFLEHPIDVNISGSGTSWTSDATVDFGPEIAVAEVTVSSPTSLIASVAPTRDAQLGTRSITVTDQGEKISFDGLKVKAPIAIVNTTGTVAQGSIMLIDLKQLDPETPFDVRSPGGSAIDKYPYLDAFLEAQGTEAIISEASGFYLKVQFKLDVTASTGPTGLVIGSGTETQSDTSALPAALDIASRAPIELTAGMTTTQTITDPVQSMLYSATASAGQLVHLNLSVSSPEALSRFYHLPQSGSFDDVVSLNSDFKQFVASGSSKTNYFIYIDANGATGYDITVDTEQYGTSSESESNNDSGSANAITGGITGSIGTLGDQDYFAVSAMAGQTITASTGPGITNPSGPGADPELGIYLPDGTTQIIFSDSDYYDTASLDVTSDGTYFVRVGASADFCSECTFDYSLLITVE